MEEFFKIKILKEFDKEDNSQAKNIRSRQVLKAGVEDKSNLFSLSDIGYLDCKEIEKMIFILHDEDKKKEKPTSYVKIKRTNYIKNNQLQTIIQFMDISDSINLYDEQKDRNEFLQLVNACVSHELRNPLNSIIA